MLAQWLERAGHKMILLLPSAALSPELLARFTEGPATAIRIASVRPLAFVPVRRLGARLHREQPGNHGGRTLAELYLT